MAVPVFFLLTGTLFAEWAVIGPRWMGLVGAGLLAMSALALNGFRHMVDAKTRGTYLDALGHVQAALGGTGRRGRPRDHVRVVR
jgi:hypothetical protein